VDFVVALAFLVVIPEGNLRLSLLLLLPLGLSFPADNLPLKPLRP
jgi:hypothetical protein